MFGPGMTARLQYSSLALSKAELDPMKMNFCTLNNFQSLPGPGCDFIRKLWTTLHKIDNKSRY